MAQNINMDATVLDGIDFNDPAFLEAYSKNLQSQRWRLDHLYMIVNEKGEKVPFHMNLVQRLLYLQMWFFNLVLKARQPGITTFTCLLYLDYCLFNSNTHALFISHSKDKMKETYENIIRFAYEELPFFVREANPAISDSATGMRFANGSSILVTMSGRGGTYQLVHISEYGKICAKWPQKAREIKTGVLNAIHAGQMLTVESTAEGREGNFYEMCQVARKHQELSRKLSKLDFKFFFFPWYMNTLNNLDVDENDLIIYEYQQKYFAQLEANLKIKLRPSQKGWYLAKWNVQGDDMKQEHPSTADEAFEAAIEGTYYTTQFQQARKDGRITKVPHQEGILVDTWWDLGVDDYTAIWMTQDVGREIHAINFYFNSGEGFGHYYDYLDELRRNKGYRYGKHGAPHDVVQRDRFRAESYLDAARKQGFVFKIAPKLSILSGIQAVRRMFTICWFNEEECGTGLDMMEKYRKQWNETTGAYRDQPFHDPNSHAADAFRTLATAHEFTSAYALDLHREQTERRNLDKKDPRGWT